eukprot:TRINITY_DN1746_c0_g2_i1.p2 TRINITY_DN1746_c0_g2~~TRINITY_DN1746_c0_g2_i1.p2  ORF type:complete len:175 (+),score=26.73 TRINITY_DN1746_c0_g2_i1:67-591(+)
MPSLVGSEMCIRDRDGTLQKEKVSALARPYFLAFCGEPTATEFNTTTRVFNFAYKWNRDCKENDAEFYASEDFHYANGVTLKLEGCDDCVLERQKRNYYRIKHPRYTGERLIKARISPQQEFEKTCTVREYSCCDGLILPFFLLSMLQVQEIQNLYSRVTNEQTHQHQQAPVLV